MTEPPARLSAQGDAATTEIWLIELEPLSRLLADAEWRASSDLTLIEAAVTQATPPQAAGSPGRRWAARIALRVLLARWAGIETASAPFVISPGGKPALASGPPPFFSLSHSEGRALVALSPRAEIGIDIEAPRSPRLAPNRRQQIIAAGIAMAGGQPLPGDTLDRQMLQAWVRLEAIAKCDGCGMCRLLGRIGIFGGGGAPSAPAIDRGPDVLDIALDQGFVAAMAGPVSQWDGHVRVFPASLAGIERLAGQHPAGRHLASQHLASQHLGADERMG